MLSWKVWYKCNVLLWKWYLSHYLLLMQGSCNGEGGTYVSKPGSLKAGWGNTYCVRELLPSSLARRLEKSCAAACCATLYKVVIVSFWCRRWLKITDEKYSRQVWGSNKDTYHMGLISSLDFMYPGPVIRAGLCDKVPTPNTSECGCI